MGQGHESGCFDRTLFEGALQALIFTIFNP